MCCYFIDHNCKYLSNTNWPKKKRSKETDRQKKKQNKQKTHQNEQETTKVKYCKYNEKQHNNNISCSSSSRSNNNSFQQVIFFLFPVVPNRNDRPWQKQTTTTTKARYSLTNTARSDVCSWECMGMEWFGSGNSKAIPTWSLCSKSFVISIWIQLLRVSKREWMCPEKHTQAKKTKTR